MPNPLQSMLPFSDRPPCRPCFPARRCCVALYSWKIACTTRTIVGGARTLSWGMKALTSLLVTRAWTGDLAFIVTRRGTPWNNGALGTKFVAAARAAGVVGKSAHAMRKASDEGCRERSDRTRTGGDLRLVRRADGDPLH